MLPLFAGLRPVRSRVMIDLGVLVILFRNCLVSTARSLYDWSLLAAVVAGTLVTAGPTARWPITLSVVPYVFFAAVRAGCELWWETHEEGALADWTSWFARVAQALCAVVATVLALFLFPALELRPIEGEHHVGVVDVFLPVASDDRDENDNDAHVSVKLLYPIDVHRSSGKTPTTTYMDPDDGHRVCDEMMRIGSPPPLSSKGWLFHYQTLARLQGVRRGAPLASSSSESDDDGEKKRFPTAVYSHGLLGYAGCYLQQGLALAAQGRVVAMPNHADGSSVLTKRRDGSYMYYRDVEKELKAKDENTQDLLIARVRKRRAQVELRIREFLAVVDALRALNTTNLPELEAAGISFVGRLDIEKEDTIYAGHSFGAATALGAACRRREADVSTVILHDPATDWAPDDVRRALFHERFGGGGEGPRYGGGTGGYEPKAESNGAEGSTNGDGEENMRSSSSSALSRLDMLVLFSEEFTDKNWGESELFRLLHQEGLLGREDGPSDCGYVAGSRHQEFSDMCCLTPLWLARILEFSGPERSPLDTLEESVDRTEDFLRRAKSEREKENESSAH